MKEKDGTTYDGQWSETNFTIGIIKYPDGSKYEGEFKEEKKHGKGIFTTAKGEV